MGAAPILTISKNGETIKSLSLDKESDVGRSEGCVIRLEDRAISRHHAVFRPVAGGIQVEKKSEFAPLVVNGSDCTRAMLKEGDVISIGPYLMRLSMSNAKKEVKPIEPAAVDTGAPPQPVFETKHFPLDSPVDSQVNSGANADVEGAADVYKLDEVPDAGMPLQLVRESPSQALSFPLQMEGSGQASPIESFVPDRAEESKATATPVGFPEEDAVTKIVDREKLKVHLIFKPGTANYIDYELDKDEIYLGRGKSCDIVIKDKKASRQNAVIKRHGLGFVIQDLQSANGTYVNGNKITEHELSGEDRVKIGNVEFQFKAVSADYVKGEKDFLYVSTPQFESAVPESFPDSSVNDPMGEPSGVSEGSLPPVFKPRSSRASIPMPVSQPTQEVPGLPGDIPDIVGISPSASPAGGRKSLFQKYRELPQRRKWIWTAIILFVFYYAFIDEDEPALKTKARTSKKLVSQTAPSGRMKLSSNFENLTPDERRFVQNQHDLAFNYYTAKDYDRALFEITKIFTLVNDYKDSREIERYAKDGKQKIAAQEEDKRRREEEARIKSKVAALVEEVRGTMLRKQYAKARDLFPEILAIDPDNVTVAEWKRVVDDWDEQQTRLKGEQRVQDQINADGWNLYKEGLGYRRQGRLRAAIASFVRVKDIGATNPKLLHLSRMMIQKSRSEIQGLLAPLLDQAKQSETANDMVKAYGLYERVTQIDPPNSEGHLGMGRTRGVLHERAKTTYTEAVLAESYSDFETAKKKFGECITTAPRDDIYHERAQRKLARYFKAEDHTP